MSRFTYEANDTNANSLSMLSPNPGVSTMVRAMRTPSSSSSVEDVLVRRVLYKRGLELLTNVDGLNPDAFLDVCGVWVVRNFVRQDLGLAKSIHKSRTASSRSTCARRVENRVATTNVKNGAPRRQRRR